MPAESADLAMLAMALVLGARHGLDADHIAAVDGLTRFGLASGRAAAGRWSGTLFSLGHGAVVMAVALGVALLAREPAVPEWFGPIGAAVSIAFLTVIGLANLAAVVTTPAHAMVAPVGVRTRFMRRFLRTSHPGGVVAIGALFALSFDTLTQATLFAMAGGRHGIGFAVALGLAFTLGMAAADGANGWWLARLVGRADRSARIASRVMALAVGGLSLVIAALGAARFASETIDAWADAAGLAIGLGAIALALIAFAIAIALARGAAATTPLRAAP